MKISGPHCRLFTFTRPTNKYVKLPAVIHQKDMCQWFAELAMDIE